MAWESGIRGTRVQIQHQLLMSLCPWENHFTSLSLIFLILPQMEIRLLHRICVKLHKDIREPNIMFGTEQLLSEQWLPFSMRMKIGVEDGGEDNVQDKPAHKRGPLIGYLAHSRPAQFTMMGDLSISAVKSSLCVQPMNSYPLRFCDQLALGVYSLLPTLIPSDCFSQTLPCSKETCCSSVIFTFKKWPIHIQSSPHLSATKEQASIMMLLFGNLPI